MRKQFTMTGNQLKELLAACQPTPVMLIGGVNTGRSAQENANAAWARLGAELGFDPMSVKPIPGKGEEFFTAEVIDG